MKKTLFMAFIILLIFGCKTTTVKKTAKKVAITNVTNIEKNRDNFYRNGFTFNLAIEDIKKNLGKPNKLQIEKIQNIHDINQIDEIHDIQYEGLSFKIYKINTKPVKELKISAEVTNPKYKLKYGLKISVSKNTIIKVLGEPNKISKGIMHYTLKDMINAGFQVYLKDDKVIKITWAYYFD